MTNNKLRILSMSVFLYFIAVTANATVNFNNIVQNKKNMNHLQWEKYFNSLEGKIFVDNITLVRIEDPFPIFGRTYTLRFSPIEIPGCVSIIKSGFKKNEVFNLKIGAVYKITGKISKINIWQSNYCKFFIELK